MDHQTHLAFCPPRASPLKALGPRTPAPMRSLALPSPQGALGTHGDSHLPSRLDPKRPRAGCLPHDGMSPRVPGAQHGAGLGVLGGNGGIGGRQQRAPSGAGRGPHLRNIPHALQLVVLSNVYIWKLCWLAVALSGLMFDLMGGKAGSRFPEPPRNGSRQTSRAPERGRESGGWDSEPGSAPTPGQTRGALTPRGG